VTSNQKNILVIFGVAAPVAITYLLAEDIEPKHWTWCCV
jgi:hypothetical protein